MYVFPVKVSDREERLLHLQLELTTLRTSQEHTRRALAVKEQLHAQLSQENRVVRENMSSLQNQVPAVCCDPSPLSRHQPL